jgi:hypothetical protein
VPAPAAVPSGAFVAFSCAKSFVPSFSGNNTDKSVLRNPSARNASTACSTSPCQNGLRRALRKQRSRMPPGDYRYCACSRLHSSSASQDGFPLLTCTGRAPRHAACAFAEDRHAVTSRRTCS